MDNCLKFHKFQIRLQVDVGTYQNPEYNSHESFFEGRVQNYWNIAVK